MVFEGAEGTHVHLFSDGVCEMSVGYSDKEKWATIYSIETAKEERNKGHASGMISHFVKRFKGYKLGSTVSLHPAITKLIKRYNLIEYKS